MISIIVPVYNVEPYLRRCLDSIIGQTYRDLEILVIDDGSTDHSGKICDEYAELDERIKVFHTENQGLSAARNLGLDYAEGGYIGFVDSDDWIEPDMYEVLLKKAEETGADVVECGWYWEYDDRTEKSKSYSLTAQGIDAIQLLLNLTFQNGVWNKLWKSRCFENIFFPEGRIHEDVAITYKIFERVDSVCAVDENKYHYLQRKGSLSKKRTMQSLIDYWISHKERYDVLYNQVDQNGKWELEKYCSLAVARTWAHYYDYDTKERDKLKSTVHEMNEFTTAKLPLIGKKNWDWGLRCGVLFSHFNNIVSFRIAWMMNRLRIIIEGVERYL